MKAVILINPYLDREAEFYQPRRIKEELEALGVRCDILQNAWLADVGGELGEKFTETYDFCVYLDKDKYLPRILEKRGMRLFNHAEAVELCDDKMLTHIALAGLPMPRTFFAPLCYKRGGREDAGAVGSALGYPVVVKECYGSLGEQVYLARDGEELAALSERLKHLPHLIQEYIAESGGRDLRVICVGGKAVAAMKRTSEGDFRSNLGRGGKGEKVEPDDEAKALSERAASLLGLDYCGVDLLFGKDGYLLCEVNSNAFFGGIERVTGVNVARLYAEHMVNLMQK